MENPKVVLLVGTSVDGKVTVAPGKSSKSFASRLRSSMRAPIEEMRNWAQAVVISSGTVIADDPSLRSETNRDLVRVVLDRSLRTPLERKVFLPGAKTIVITCRPKTDPRAIELNRRGIEVLHCSEQFFLREAKDALISRQIVRILIEGGGTFNAALFQQHIVDEIIVAHFPFLMGGANTPTLYDGPTQTSVDDALALELLSTEVIDQMIVARYRLHYT